MSEIIPFCIVVSHRLNEEIKECILALQEHTRPFDQIECYSKIAAYQNAMSILMDELRKSQKTDEK